MRNWLWKCTRCPAHGTKLNTHRKALHYGKWHIIQKHHVNEYPILERIIE